MEKHLQIGGATVISTHNKPECEKSSTGEHDWSGDEYITFYDHKPMFKSEFDKLLVEEQDALNQESGQCVCRHCGMLYMEFDNPFYHEF